MVQLILNVSSVGALPFSLERTMTARKNFLFHLNLSSDPPGHPQPFIFLRGTRKNVLKCIFQRDECHETYIHELFTSQPPQERDHNAPQATKMHPMGLNLL